MEIATQIRTCQVGACSESVPTSLGPQGVCLGHYIDQAFTRVDAALSSCSRGQLPDPSTLAWLKAQGDFTVQMLAGGGSALAAEHRTRLLELLLCLAKTHEQMQQIQQRPAGRI